MYQVQSFDGGFWIKDDCELTWTDNRKEAAEYDLESDAWADAGKLGGIVVLKP